MAKVAVLGASGFVGAHVVQALLSRGAEVVALRAPRLSPGADMELAVSELVRALDGCDAVVNAAGVAEATSTDIEMTWANSIMPGVVAKAANAHGIRFVHVSSAATQGRRPVLDSSSETAPFSPYSKSKARAEELIRDSPGRNVVYRPPGVHSPTREVTRSVAKIARSPLSSVAAPGNQRAPHAWATNVGDAIALLAISQSEPPPIVHHPFEGVTTRGLLQQLGGRDPRLLPPVLASAVVSLMFAAGRLSPRLTGHARRLEVMWFGQNQATSWLSEQNWIPRVRLTQWHTALPNRRDDPSTRTEGLVPDSVNQPRVHVLLAARNGERYLRQQVNSILAQVGVTTALTIRVDPSADDTYGIARQLARENANISVVRNETSSGSASANFLNLLQKDTGTRDAWIALSDQDDMWDPHKLRRAVDQLEDKCADGYSSDVYALWPDGRRRYIRKSGEQTRFDHLLSSPGPGCTFVMRAPMVRAFAAATSSVDPPADQLPLHDWLLYAWARENGYKWFIDSVALMDYRQHEANAVGANKGWAAVSERLKSGSRKWYITSAHDLMTILDATTPPELRTRLPNSLATLLMNASKLRRSLPESLVCAAVLASSRANVRPRGTSIAHFRA